LREAVYLCDLQGKVFILWFNKSPLVLLLRQQTQSFPFCQFCPLGQGQEGWKAKGRD
jgi:hypothetical protein